MQAISSSAQTVPAHVRLCTVRPTRTRMRSPPLNWLDCRAKQPPSLLRSRKMTTRKHVRARCTMHAPFRRIGPAVREQGSCCSVSSQPNFGDQEREYETNASKHCPEQDPARRYRVPANPRVPILPARRFYQLAKEMRFKLRNVFGNLPNTLVERPRPN